MESLALGLFCLVLILNLILKIDIVYALLFGLVIFIVYALLKKYRPKEIANMMWDGIKTAAIVIVLFTMVGFLTASWRAGGTVAYIVSYAAKLIKPEVFYLMTFLLNCAVSMLIGTATGTGGTIGVICATFGSAIGANMAVTGGAIVCGAYFGDRCSPVSTSLLLVTQLTGTNHYKNIKRLLKGMIVPFVASCIIYFVFGITQKTGGAVIDIESVVRQEFNFYWWLTIPAILVIVMALLKAKTLIILLASIFTASLCMIFGQKFTVLETLKVLILGFSAQNADVAKMLNGGGLVSMISLVLVITISATYAGIFKATGMLIPLKKVIKTLSEKLTPFGAMSLTGMVTSMIACNQTLAIILTDQLNGDSYEDKEKLVSMLCDSAVVIAPLIPWCIAGTSIMTPTGTPLTSLFFACYLYLQVIWTFIKELKSRRRLNGTH